MTIQIEPGCEFCDKRGLPVLPVRYAIAPKTAGAPSTRALDADGKAIVGLGSHAHYTRRLLRNGYLYVYDEARKRWEGYFITNSAHFMRFQVGKPVPSVYTADKQPCDRAGHQEVAGMITIPDPKNATQVWFDFSDVEWTAAVLKKHQDAAYRKKHMQVLDVKKALAHAKQPNVHALKELSGKVAEYACDPAKARTADGFKDAVFPFNARKPQLEETLAAANALRKDAGIILSLHDPVGVAVELSTAMSQRYDQFIHQSHLKHPLAVSDTIAALRKTIAHQAELWEIDETRHRAKHMLPGNAGLFFPTEFDGLEEGTPHITAAQLKAAADSSWKKYLKKYDEPKRVAFQKDFDAKLQAFDASHVAPLAQAHAAWMKSLHMAVYFECNYDPADADSGAAYTTTLTLCIGATQDKTACFDVYADWLAGSLTDKTNLLLRGLILNQDEVANIIASGSANVTNPKLLPWEAMIGNVGKMVGHVIEGKPDLLGKLIVATLGAIGQLAKRFAPSGSLPHALVAAGVISKTPIVRLEFTGNLKGFQEYLIRELMREQVRLGGKMKTSYGMKAAIKREIRLHEIKGGKLDGTRSKYFLVAVDLDVIKGVPKNAGQRAQSAALAKAIANINDLEALELGRWRAAVARGTTVSKTAAPFAFAGLGAVLQIVALTALSEEVDKATQKKEGVAEAQWRMGAGVAALVGTAADTLGTALEKMPATRLKYGSKFIEYASAGLKGLGRGLGVAGAVIVAVFDFGKSWDAKQKGQKGLAIAYFTSAILGVGGTVLMFMSFASATGIGLFLVLLAIGLSFAIDYIRDNPIQEWLEAGYFKNKTFKTAEEELNKLKAVTA
ncbi:MAG: hypothetical protein IV085_06635 [Thiobacillus sp.]|nr:hypothetical protein [Thiobacillus sp.]